jgi:hypothetical protein
LTLDKVKQLVDINGDLTNFKAVVAVMPKSEELYEFAFVNQTIIDNAEDFSYTRQTGPFNHSFTINDDLYQNHFLCLRCPTPLDVDVKVMTEELPTNVVKNKIESSTKFSPPVEGEIIQEPPNISEEKFYHQTWFKVAAFIATATAIYFAYIYFFEKSKKTEQKIPNYEFASIDIPPIPHVDIPPIPNVDIPPIPHVDIPPIPHIDIPQIQNITEPIQSVQKVSFNPVEGYKPRVNDFTTKLLSKLKNIPNY